MKTLLGLAVLLTFLTPPLAAASPCAIGCAVVELEPCVGAFAVGAGPIDAVWTLTYSYPGGSTSETSTGVPPPYAGPGNCAIPGCYGASLTNSYGYSRSPISICIA